MVHISTAMYYAWCVQRCTIGCFVYNPMTSDLKPLINLNNLLGHLVICVKTSSEAIFCPFQHRDGSCAACILFSVEAPTRDKVVFDLSSTITSWCIVLANNRQVNRWQRNWHSSAVRCASCGEHFRHVVTSFVGKCYHCSWLTWVIFPQSPSYNIRPNRLT